MREALILASVVEKEVGNAAERRTVAGLYSNRVRTGMLLQADPTIIYPITKGKPLGRRIRQSGNGAVRFARGSINKSIQLRESERTCHQLLMY